eukprot:142884_1
MVNIIKKEEILKIGQYDNESGYKMTISWESNLVSPSPHHHHQQIAQKQVEVCIEELKKKNKKLTKENYILTTTTNRDKKIIKYFETDQQKSRMTINRLKKEKESIYFEYNRLDQDHKEEKQNNEELSAKNVSLQEQIKKIEHRHQYHHQITHQQFEQFQQEIMRELKQKNDAIWALQQEKHALTNRLSATHQILNSMQENDDSKNEIIERLPTYTYNELNDDDTKEKKK